MKIAVFNYLDFSYVGSYEVGDYKVIRDLLVPQNSTFQIIDPSGIEKQMVVVCPLKNGSVYIGIVTQISFDNDSNMSTVTVQDISSILSVEVSLEAFTSAGYGAKIKEWFDAIFVTSSDPLEKLSWFSCVNNSSVEGASPAWSANSTETLLTAISDFMDLSSLGMSFSLNSSHTGVVMTLFDRSSSEATIKLTEEFVSNISYSGTSESATNKVVMKPQADNYLNKTTLTYYLLNDGTVSTDATSNLRLSPVSSKILFYSDTQYDPSTLQATAASNLLASVYSHEISFRIRTIGISIPTIKTMISSIYCGMKITLYGVPGEEASAFSTIISKITFSDDDYIDITCGYSRSSLTDRLKMSKQDKGQTVSVSYKIAPGSKSGFDSKTYTQSAPHTDIASLSATIALPAGAILQSVSSSYPGSANETSDNWTIMDNQPRISETYDETTKVWTVTVTVRYNLSSTFTSDFRLNLSVLVSYAYITT